MNNFLKSRIIFCNLLRAQTLTFPKKIIKFDLRKISFSYPAKTNQTSSNGGQNFTNDIKLHYEKISNETLESLTERLDELSDELDDLISNEYDVSFSNGVLNLKLGSQHGTFVINKQTPNLQIWLSSPISGPKRFDFIDNTWVYKRTGETLHGLLAKELSDIFKTVIDMKKCSYSLSK